jgi:hypothetical protein
MMALEVASCWALTLSNARFFSTYFSTYTPPFFALCPCSVVLRVVLPNRGSHNYYARMQQASKRRKEAKILQDLPRSVVQRAGGLVQMLIVRNARNGKDRKRE